MNKDGFSFSFFSFFCCCWFFFPLDEADTPELVDTRREPVLLTHSSPGVLLAEM